MTGRTGRHLQRILRASAFAGALAFVLPVAAELDVTPWLGKNRPNLAAELKAYGPLCERRVAHAIAQVTPDFLKNQRLTEGICRCASAALKSEKDPVFVQIVNMNLRGQSAKISKMPPQLSLYLVDYQELELDCVQQVAGTPVSQNVRSAASVPAARSSTASPKKSKAAQKSRPRQPTPSAR